MGEHRMRAGMLTFMMIGVFAKCAVIALEDSENLGE